MEEGNESKGHGIMEAWKTGRGERNRRKGMDMGSGSKGDGKCGMEREIGNGHGTWDNGSKEEWKGSTGHGIMEARKEGMGEGE